VGALFMRAMQEITKDGWHAEHHVRHRESQREFPSKGVEFMFPNFFLLPSFSAMSSYRIGR